MSVWDNILMFRKIIATLLLLGVATLLLWGIWKKTSSSTTILVSPHPLSGSPSTPKKQMPISPISSSTTILAPPQAAYQGDPEIVAGLQFMALRWKTPVAGLYVLVDRRGGSSREIGIVDVSSLESARLLIVTPDFVNPEQAIRNPLAHEGKNYLLNEFRPTSPREFSMVQTFYTMPTPSFDKTDDFAVILWWNVASSGDGSIRALTSTGYFMVPVQHDIIRKNFGYYAN